MIPTGILANSYFLYLGISGDIDIFSWLIFKNPFKKYWGLIVLYGKWIWEVKLHWIYRNWKPEKINPITPEILFDRFTVCYKTHKTLSANKLNFSLLLSNFFCYVLERLMFKFTTSFLIKNSFSCQVLRLYNCSVSMKSSKYNSFYSVLCTWVTWMFILL